MPKVSAADRPQQMPGWSEAASFGVHHVNAGSQIEVHFHDCHEYWIIISGAGVAISENEQFHLMAGDMLLTKAGDYHSMDVTSDMVPVTYYGRMPKHGRPGHLHQYIDPPWAEYIASLPASETQ